MQPKNSYYTIDTRFREKHGRSVKPCWIADVKEANGIVLKSMANRVPGFERKHPCPPAIRPHLESVIRELGVLPPAVN